MCDEVGPYASVSECLLHEFAHQAGNGFAIFFQREVSGVQQVKLDILQIALVGMRAFRRENLVVLAPDDQLWAAGACESKPATQGIAAGSSRMSKTAEAGCPCCRGG